MVSKDPVFQIADAPEDRPREEFKFGRKIFTGYYRPPAQAVENFRRPAYAGTSLAKGGGVDNVKN